MKTKMLVTTIMVAMLSSTAAFGQKIVVDGDMVIIDASAMTHVTDKKARTTLATNITNAPVNDLTDIASKQSNDKVYKKFEISKTDNSSAANWLTAVNTICDGTINGSTGWRLPTQRELILIWILKPVLEQQNNFDEFFPNSYWSATSNGDKLGARINFGSSFVDGELKTYSYRVRCVRDI